ncbi:xanthine dehydrogenase family protein molybdopterin-binding subunit [Natrialba swarupiae]|nr:xanthine dehydrogenase family protein molybdopterin-binding subunit [Natrialba swarupiae]
MEGKTKSQTDTDEDTQYKGRSIQRLEDDRILSGNSRYVDDIELPGMLHATVVRSMRSHALIEEIDTSEAEEMDGVVDTLTGEEAAEMANRYGSRRSGMMDDHPPLAQEKVRFAGEGVVAVAAESHYLAKDAASTVSVSYDPLPSMVELDDALDPESEDELVHPELDEADEDVSGNVWGSYSIDIGDVEAAFDEADTIVSHEIETSRPTAVPLEPHGAVADYDPADDVLTLYTSTQEAHQVRRDLADTLDRPVNSIRVVQPENMGGGFGHKLELHENEIVAALLSIRTERPVKVVLDRIEEFQGTRARQPQRHELELAVDDDGSFLGIRDDITAVAGAYAALTKPGLWVSCNLVATPYRIDNIEVNGRCVFTNTVPSGAYRGFGMTQAATARESLIEKVSKELDLDPWEVRRKNLIGNEECPTTHPMGFYLDSCGTEECLGLVREDIDLSLLEEKTDDEIVRGLGVASAMHVSSAQRPAYTSDNSSVTIRMDEDGSVTVTSDQCPMGTGLETSFAQIVADELGIPPSNINFDFADTETSPFGLGSWGSRAITVAGSAAYEAGRSLRERLTTIAAHQLEAAPSDIVLEEGRFFVESDPSRSRPLEEIAYDAHYNGRKLPEEITAGAVTVTESFDSPAPGILDESGKADIAVNYPSNVHASIVEIDTRTGTIDILDYAAADDIGEVINPMIVEGQIQGGIVQGLGMALGEDLEYDASGQPVNAMMEDYQLPLINEMPMITKIREADTTSERAPLGTKGVGESGSILAPVVILNAVNDALYDEFVSSTVTEMPLDPETVYQLCRSADESGGDR